MPKAVSAILRQRGLFQCPVCALPMTVDPSASLYCPAGHRFDLAASGYVNLLTRPVATHYDKTMFAARRAVHEAGWFRPLLAEIGETLRRELHAAGRAPAVLEAGCGEGSLLSALRARLLAAGGAAEPLFVGADLAKAGIALAAKRDPSIVWCVADNASAPFRSGRFDALLTILSPSNYRESHRLLRPGGLLVKAVPESGHLLELRRRLYRHKGQGTYANRQVVERFAAFCRPLESKRLRYTVAVDDPQRLESLLHMTPLSWGADETRLREVRATGLSEITFDFTVLYGKAPS